MDEKRIVDSENDDADGDEGEDNENVKVMVRCRPLTSAELKRKESSIIVLDDGDDSRSIEIGERQFRFDYVFNEKCSNEFIYMKSMRKLVEFAFKGFNCTIFLYGQTGTGKTYTHSSLTLDSFKHLFSLIQDSDERLKFLIRASYYELYNEEIRDLLSNSRESLELRESKLKGIYVRNLSSFLVNNLNELEKLKSLGDEQRVTASTKMNEHSSRSHSIFSITIETIQSDENSNKSIPFNGVDAKKSLLAKQGQLITVGKLNLIDLAGSERQSKSGSSGVRLKEASRINLSLTCLSLVIRALTDKKSNHIPYRNSKLTRLLSSSLGGNSKTLLIACVSPAKSSLDETLNTLRFASRTKRVKNKAKINENSKDALLRKYRKQIEELRAKLREHQEGRQSKAISEEEAINSLFVGEEAKKDYSANENDNFLMQQLKLLKNKIIVGGENLLDKVEMHDKLLEANRLEMEEKRAEERKLNEELERREKLIDQMRTSKGSLEIELINLDEKLKRVLKLYKRVKEEDKDSSKEHQELKENLIQSIRAISREIKFADFIIEDFIPRDYLDLINTYAQYDDESDEWQIKYIALSGNNIAQTRRIINPSSTTIVLTSNSSASSSERSHRETNEEVSDSGKLNLNNLTTNRMEPYIRMKDFAS